MTKRLTHDTKPDLIRHALIRAQRLLANHADAIDISAWSSLNGEIETAIEQRDVELFEREVMAVPMARNEKAFAFTGRPA